MPRAYRGCICLGLLLGSHTPSPRFLLGYAQPCRERILNHQAAIKRDLSSRRTTILAQPAGVKQKAHRERFLVEAADH